MSSASTVSQPTSKSAANGSSMPNLIPATLPLPPAPSFHIHQLMPGTPMGPPGMSPSPGVLFSPSDSSASIIPGPNMHATPNSIIPSVRPQISGSYHSLTPVVSPPHAIWFQPPQLGGMPRPPFLPYSASFHGPLPFPARGMLLPSVPLPDPQPPGVTPVQVTSAIAVCHGNQLTGNSLIRTGLNHPQPDSQRHAQGVGHSEGISSIKHLDDWTAHKTEAGIIYYYNALTGESTYEKPSGFEGEPGNLMVQPTSVSMSNLSGTDWILVSMADGKKYYYNTKTKISSWQIPNEVTELRQQNDEKAKEHSAHSAPLPINNALTELGSSPISINTPAINSGGRESMPLRTGGILGTSSALDLIKKKLQDSGTPVASSPISAPTIPQSDVNIPRDADAAVKALQTENSKDKPKDANGDENVSDSSSDSDDVDSGPTNEQLIIQFKEMLKERGVAPFSKWDKELPKIVFDPRFKAIPSYSARRSLFEHFVKTRAEEEHKEKRAAQKAAIEGFKQLLDSASEDIDHTTSYPTFKKKWGNDPRFEALERKDRENLLNERRGRMQSRERGFSLKEEGGAADPPKYDEEREAEAEVEDDDDEDLIMEEVQRRLKELRRNSFMVLIPEEEEEQEQEQEAEDETSCEWRDVEAEGRQWWGGFGSVYDDYCERMLLFDRMSILQPTIQPAHESASPRSASKKTASPLGLGCLSLKRIEEPEEEEEEMSKHLQTLVDSSNHHQHHNIETAYVAQICLCWEALHCQYTQLNHLISCQPQNPNTTHYNLTAQLFQQFQVLLQRFIENEPFQQGLRPAIYARTRRSFPKMLHVPNIQASDPNGTQEQESDFLILAPDLLLIIEAAIFTFHRFLKMDKKTSNSASLSFRNQTQDANLLARVRSSMDKKKTKVKEVRKKSRGWKQKTWPQTYEDMQLLFGVVDIKIVSRLVKMSRITKEQLLWCEQKMNKLDMSNGKLRRDPSPLLFPC